MNKLINKIIFVLVMLQLGFNQNILDKNSVIGSKNRVQPVNSDSFKKFTRAKSLEKAGLWEDAEKLYKEINIDEPGDKRYFKPLKNILKQRSEWEELIEFSREFSKANNNDPKVLVDLGEVYIWAGEMELAKQTFQPLLSNAQNNPNIIKMIINKYAQNGIFDKSEEILIKSRKSLKIPEFYSMEMARLYSNRMVYDKALSEYLLYVSKNPNRLNFVSDRIVGFLSSPEIVSMIIKNLKKENSIESKLILSDIYFNQKAYKSSYELLINNDVEFRYLLDFATDLIDENELELSERVLTYIYNSNTSDQSLMEKAIFNLAVIYENKTVSSIDPLPISGLFKNNSFFKNNYLSLNEQNAGSLNQAINIYDSLVTKTNSIEANFRLAEIRFRILGDLDGAVKHYNNIINKKRNKKYLIESVSRLIDIYIAKGDIKKAMDVIKIYKKDSRLLSKLNTLKIKETQVYFYEGDIDTLSAFIKDNFSDLSFDNDWYNDILEIRSLLFNFDKKPELFSMYAEAQLLLQKNKREEALKKLYHILELSEKPLTNLIKYQLAYVLVLQAQYMNAIDIMTNIDGESIFIELSYILNGEVFDYILNDGESAINYYLEFLEKYPDSIYYDQIRLRLRELVG